MSKLVQKIDLSTGVEYAGKIQIDEINFPSSEVSAGQVFSTDGMGNYTWENPNKIKYQLGDVVESTMNYMNTDLLFTVKAGFAYILEFNLSISRVALGANAAKLKLMTASTDPFIYRPFLQATSATTSPALIQPSFMSGVPDVMDDGSEYIFDMVDGNYSHLYMRGIFKSEGDSLITLQIASNYDTKEIILKSYSYALLIK